jgi:hypothetical protein
MVHGRQISPRIQLIAEILIFVVPAGSAILLSGLSRRNKILVFAGAVLIAAIVKFFLVYSPRVTFKEQKVTAFLDHHLELLISDFENRFDTDYDIRANVMIPQKSRSITHGDNGFEYVNEKYLQIAYCAGGGPDKDVKKHSTGDRDETETKWSIDQPVQGNCGRAFVAKEVRVAGRDPSKDTWDMETTTPQDMATKQVNCIMSIPIRKPSGGDPVAVLNLDAPVTDEETNFRDEDMQKEVAEKYAEPIGTLL